MPAHLRHLLVRMACLAAAALIASGCAALTNPTADGIPVSYLPDEVLGESREAMRPVPLNLLGQLAPDVHRVGPGDVLGIVVEGVLGERNAAAPLRIDNDTGNPSVGYPIPVREDGTIVMPSVDAIDVGGKTLAEAREEIRIAYSEKRKILKAGTERILVTLIKPRQVNVLVVRQDSGSPGTSAAAQTTFTGTQIAIAGANRRGTGTTLALPIFENDVLNALTRSGGLPGTDAKNEVVVQRRPRRGDPPGGPATIRIPLRLRPDEAVPFRPEDVILREGDTVYVESRDAEVFYTAGLLGSGQFPLPRDYDLDVLQAIAAVRGPLINGGFSQTLFNASATNTGIGNPSPSLVTVLRKTADGGQIPIRVDLNLAFREPRERIRIQPGDIIVLQETPDEAIARYITNVFRLDFSNLFLRNPNVSGTATLSVP